MVACHFCDPKHNDGVDDEATTNWNCIWKFARFDVTGAGCGALALP
jgi:hypothetical protein